jgi:hypothetical protein
VSDRNIASRRVFARPLFAVKRLLSVEHHWPRSRPGQERSTDHQHDPVALIDQADRPGISIRQFQSQQEEDP